MSGVDEFDLGIETDGETAPARAPRRRRGQPWPWVLAALALVGFGAANSEATPTALGLGSGIDLRLLDQDLRQEPVALWAAEVSFASVMLTEGDRAVVVTDGSGSNQSVLGLDLATGEEVWRYVNGAHMCTWEHPVRCVESPGTDEAAIVTIDIADGTRHVRSHPGAVAASSAGESLVVVEVTGSYEERVVLIDPDGTQRWQVEVDAVDTESFPYWTQIEVVRDRLLLYVSGTTVDLATGAITTSMIWPLTADITAEVDESSPSYLVRTPERTVALDMSESLIPFDDDLGGPVALLQEENGDLVATWRADGSMLWQRSATSASCMPMARLRGVLVTYCWQGGGDRMVALDLLSGEELWELAGTSALAAADATSLLVVNHTTGVLAAVDVVTGATHWSLPGIATNISDIDEISNGLLVSGDASITRLAWA